MPAKKESSISKEQEYYSQHEDRHLMLAAKYVYDVEVYQFGPRSYNLFDSKYISSTEYSKDQVKYFTKEGVKFKTVTTLVAAPKKWLDHHGYKLKE